MNIFKNVSSKCILEGHDVTCFGDTWKEDLLPIESHSLERLYISKCTGLSTHRETFNMNFLKNVTKLNLLSLTHCELTRPPHVNYQINSVETIDLSNNLIDTNAQFPVLGLDFFKQFPNLKVLNLTKNKLTHLPKSWFDCPSRLEIVILDGNFIGGLNPYLAACFVNLKHLSLKRNRFKRLRMPSEIRKSSHSGIQIKESSGLKLFAEQNNMISKDDKKNNPKNEKLSRRHDFLGVIPQFKLLESLDLSYNKIHSIDQIPLSNLENLIRLNLAHNLLSSKLLSGVNENECDFGTAPFYITGKLGLLELDLSDNHDLTRIHNCWTFGLQNLKILKMTNCSISNIFESSFDKMKALSVLDLTSNNLSSVPKEIIVVSKTLSWLSLAQNNISQMTSSFLSSLTNLRFLNISHNRYQNLISFPILDAENKISESIADIQAITSESNSDEPIHLLSQMKHLKEIDLSFNDFIKISLVNDLPPSIKPGGELQRVDLRGNPSISQFVDFNSNDITTVLTEFLINDDLQLQCDCLLVGFIKWVNIKQIEIVGRCSSPMHLSHISITSPQVLKEILNDKSCKEVSMSSTFKTTYRLKLMSNANISQDSTQSDNDPMDDGQKKSSNQKQQVDYQKWIMTGSNLTIRCEFLSTYPIDFPINIEWQRLKLKPYDSGHYSSQDNQINNNLFLRSEKLERLDNMKYREKVESLSSNYDPRIKITQIGPVSEDTVVDKILNYEAEKNILLKRKDAAFKYVGFLLLQPVLYNDVGRYRCLINGLPTINLYGQSQLISKEENIKIFTPPRFTSTPTNPMAIIEGETAEITCRAVGNPLPLTSLGRIGSKDFPAARGRRMTMYKDDSSFFITNVRQVDAGNYSCTSRNVAGTISHNFTLKVQMPATILNKQQPRKTVRIGEALIIGFKVDGIPSPGVKWYKDGTRIVENERIRFSSDQLMLIIQSTVLTDAGIYKMSVLNALGGNEAFVIVDIIDSHGRPVHGSSPVIKDKTSTTTQDKDQTWIPDYWLSGIIIIVILSILLTSILWITVFFCFTKIIGSKKRRILRISNSMSRNSFDKTINTTTTSFSNPRIATSSIFQPLTECSIPLSLTTSTIVPHDQDNIDIDTFTDCTKNPSEFYSPQLFRNCIPYINNRFLSQPYLSNSGIDLSNKVSQSSSNSHQHQITDTCDSGIDSSQIYSETINSSDIRSMYQCKHKSKHRKNHQKQRKRYMCSNSSDSSEVIKSKKLDDGSNDDMGDRVHLDISNKDIGHESHEVRPVTLPLIIDHLHNNP